MPASSYLKFMVFAWKLGVVDIFSLFHYIQNLGIQYGSFAVSRIVVDNTTLFNIIASSILGLKTSAFFIASRANMNERAQQIAMLAYYLSTNAGTAAFNNCDTNALAGASACAYFNFMEDCLKSDSATLDLSKVLQKNITNTNTSFNISQIRGGGILLIVQNSFLLS